MFLYCLVGGKKEEGWRLWPGEAMSDVRGGVFCVFRQGELLTFIELQSLHEKYNKWGKEGY